MDSTNAIIRQRGHSESKQIAINASNYWDVIAAASSAAAAPKYNKIKAEPDILSRRRYKELLRLQKLQI